MLFTCLLYICSLTLGLLDLNEDTVLIEALSKEALFREGATS